MILVILFSQQPYLQPQHWGELGLFFIFFMDSSHATFKHLNAPFWTLAIEWQFYMLLPLLVLGMRALVRRVPQVHQMRTVIACVLGVIAWGLFSRAFGDYFVNQHLTQTLLLPRPFFNTILVFTYGMSGKYLEDFGVGMLLSLCVIQSQRFATASHGRSVFRRWRCWFWGTGPLCLLIMILWTYNDSYPGTWPLFGSPILFHVYPVVNELGISLSFGLCICALLCGPAWLRHPFEWLPLRWLGTISYSVYMWHLPLLFLCIHWIQPLLNGWSPEQVYGIYCLWMVGIVLPFCFFFFRWVEEPGIKLGKRLLSRRDPPAPPPEPARPVLVASGVRTAGPVHCTEDGTQGDSQERKARYPPS